MRHFFKFIFYGCYPITRCFSIGLFTRGCHYLSFPWLPKRLIYTPFQLFISGFPAIFHYHQSTMHHYCCCSTKIVVKVVLSTCLKDMVTKIVSFISKERRTNSSSFSVVGDFTNRLQCPR